MGCYLVTGGAGFIGSHLTEALLEAGHTVRVIDDLSTGHRLNLPPGVPLTAACITDHEALAEAADGCDGIFHLAAVASVQRCTEAWAETHKVNQSGTIAVFEVARRLGVPVVYASSAAVYGACEALPIIEDTPPAPLTAYGADKLGSELHARVAGGVHGVRTFGLRFFNVFGPRQDPSSPYSGVVSIFADRLGRGQDVTVHGDGLQSRDFVYVGDVARALMAAMGHADTTAPVSNVCTGRAITVLDLVETLCALTGSAARVSHGPARAGDIRHSLGDPQRLRAVLGVEAQVGLRDGLAALLAESRAAPAAE